jgi:homocitrate synthase NifV
MEIPGCGNGGIEMVRLTRDSLDGVVQELPYELASTAAPLRLRDVRIVDTTCRDGEQMPGISFTIEEKLDMCRRLEAIGIEQVETFATFNDSDRSCARRLAESMNDISIMGWNRMVAADIEDTVSSGIDAVSISTDTSDLALKHKLKMSREDQLSRLTECVELAKSHGVYVCFNAGDATRTRMEHLVEFGRAGRAAGGDRFRICDTVGVLTPRASANMVSTLMSEVDIDLEFHAHNDFGLAVANALAACEAATRFENRPLWVSTTVNGLGERAGNVPLEVFLMNLHEHHGVEKYRLDRLLSLCRRVEDASGQRIPLNYPVVGGNMFTHKSGIHVDGVLKNPDLYEAINPEKIGAERRISLGKHSGRAAIRHKLEKYELNLSSADMERIRTEVNRISEVNKRDLTDEEFLEICRRTGCESMNAVQDDARALGE